MLLRRGFFIISVAEKNIKKYFLFRFFSRFYFYFPILIIFFNDKGLSLLETASIIAVYSSTVVVFTYIGNSLSDRYGRKQFLAIGEFCKAFGCLLLCLGNSVSIFIVGEFFCGLGFAIVAGTDSAFLYENFSSIGKEKDYKLAESKSHSYLFFSVLIAGIIGSIVYTWDNRIPFILTVPFNIIAGLIALTFINVKISKKEKTVSSFKNVLRALKGNVLFYVVLYAIVRGVIMTAFICFVPFYLFYVLNFDIAIFGLLFAVYMLTGYFSGKYVNKIEKKLGEIKLSIFLCFLLSAVLFLLGYCNNVFGIGLPILLYFVAGCIRPFAMSNLNMLINDNAIRGSILSFSELLYGVFNLIFIFVSFWIFDLYGLKNAFYSMFLIFTCFSVILLGSKIKISRGMRNSHTMN